MAGKLLCKKVHHKFIHYTKSNFGSDFEMKNPQKIPRNTNELSENLVEKLEMLNYFNAMKNVLGMRHKYGRYGNCLNFDKILICLKAHEASKNLMQIWEFAVSTNNNTFLLSFQTCATNFKLT